MDKIIRRTTYVKSYRARQIVRESAARAAQRRGEIRRTNRQLTAERSKTIAAHKADRREDWFLGPIAPRRDAGEKADTYGTVSVKFIQGVKKVRAVDWGIRKGDRVAVTDPRHREWGKIGTVREWKRKEEVVIVEGVNLCDIAMPEHFLVNDPDKTPVRTIEHPIPLSSVRLVYPLYNEDTGQNQDTIIDSLTIAKEPGDSAPYLRDKLRFITDSSTSIPWPPRDDPTYETRTSDTPQSLVETRTWIPTLAKPPIPTGVIDELRNKYSKYRDRHEPSYIKYHEEKAARREKKAEEKRVAMMTPMEEWRWRKEKEAEGRPEPEPSEGLLEGIGRIMAQNQEGWMDRGRGGKGREEARA